MYLIIWTENSNIITAEIITSYEIYFLIEGELKIVAFKDGEYYELDGIYLKWKKVEKM